MRRNPILTLAAFALLLLTVGPATTAHAAARHDGLPLHARSSGPRVGELQYLLRDPRPKQNPWTQIRGTFKGQPNYYFGARTKSAVIKWKYRFGYPAHKGQCGAPQNLVIPTAGRTFFAYLHGKARPACWASLVAARLKAVNTGPSANALRIRAYAQLLLDANIHEIPDNSNRGPGINYTATFRLPDGSSFTPPPLQSGTGQYGVAWCVSTWQTIFKKLGLGTFANDTAGVYSAVDYFAARHLTFAKAKVGALVAFITYDSHGRRVIGTGHMAFVMKVEAGSFTYSAGNDGNRFRERTIPYGSRPYTFIYPPGVA